MCGSNAVAGVRLERSSPSGTSPVLLSGGGGEIRVPSGFSKPTNGRMPLGVRICRGTQALEELCLSKQQGRES